MPQLPPDQFRKWAAGDALLVNFSAKDLAVVLAAQLQADRAVRRQNLARATDDFAVGLGHAPEHTVTMTRWA